MTSRRWTDEETALARELLAAKAPEHEFRRRLGRGLKYTKYRIRYLDDADFRARQNANSRDENMRRLRHVKHPPVPNYVAPDLAEWPATTTAFLMGDPPPGRSALDQRERGSRIVADILWGDE